MVRNYENVRESVETNMYNKVVEKKKGKITAQTNNSRVRTIVVARM